MAIALTDRQQLANVDKRIEAVLKTGQEYTIVGNRMVKNPLLKDLLNLKKWYERRLLRASGATGKTLPDFRQRAGTRTRGFEDFEQAD